MREGMYVHMITVRSAHEQKKMYERAKRINIFQHFCHSRRVFLGLTARTIFCLSIERGNVNMKIHITAIFNDFNLRIFFQTILTYTERIVGVLNITLR